MRRPPPPIVRFVPLGMTHQRRPPPARPIAPLSLVDLLIVLAFAAGAGAMVAFLLFGLGLGRVV